MREKLFCGCGTALATPFRDGKIDLSALKALIKFQLLSGVNALILLGSTGEPCALNDDERAQIIETCVSMVAGRIPVYVGTGANDTQRAIGLSVDAQRRGADGLLIVTPYYNLANHEGLLRHYRAIADRVQLPIIVYNVPARTGVNLAPKTMAELAKHPLLCAVKEACPDIRHAMRLFDATAGGAVVYAGNDDLILPLMALGARGAISVASNVAPKPVSILTDACLRGDYTDANRLREAILPLLNALTADVNPIPVKAALSILGICKNEMRLPLTPMDAEIIRETVLRYSEI